MEEEVFPGQLKEKKFYYLSPRNDIRLLPFDRCEWLAAVALGMRLGEPVESRVGHVYRFRDMKKGFQVYFRTKGRFDRGFTRGEGLRTKIEALFQSYGLSNPEDERLFRGTVKRNMRKLKASLRGVVKKQVAGVASIERTFLVYLRVDKTGKIKELGSSYSPPADDEFLLGIRTMQQGDKFPIISVAFPEEKQLDPRTRGVIDVTLTLVNLDLFDV